MDTAVLVLNQNYEPLNVCTARRALVLVLRGRAEVVEIGRGVIRSAKLRIQLPSVIRLVQYIRRPRTRVRLSRREVFARDGFMCMYCGKEAPELTLDHVVPRHRGGRHSWTNLAAACKKCNHRKAGRTPAEARMRLIRRPFEPKVSPYYLFRSYLEANDGWRKFVPGA